MHGHLQDISRHCGLQSHLPACSFVVTCAGSTISTSEVQYQKILSVCELSQSFNSEASYFSGIGCSRTRLKSPWGCWGRGRHPQPRQWWQPVAGSLNKHRRTFHPELDLRFPPFLAISYTHTVCTRIIGFIIYEASVYSLQAENNYHQHTGLCQAFLRYCSVDIMMAALDGFQLEIACP